MSSVKTRCVVMWMSDESWMKSSMVWEFNKLQKLVNHVKDLLQGGKFNELEVKLWKGLPCNKYQQS